MKYEVPSRKHDNQTTSNNFKLLQTIKQNQTISNLIKPKPYGTYTRTIRYIAY